MTCCEDNRVICVHETLPGAAFPPRKSLGSVTESQTLFNGGYLEDQRYVSF